MKEGVKLILTIAIVGVLTLGLLAVLYLQVAHVGYGPFKGDDSIEAKLDKLQVRLDEANRSIDQIADKKKELKQLTAVAREARQLLPKDQSSDELLRAIWKKAEVAGVVARAIEPKKSRGQGMAQGEYEPMPFSIAITGTYDQIGVFINKMEEFEITGADGRPEQRFFEVQEIKIEAEDAGMNAHGLLKCGMIMRTYKYTGGEGEENL